MAGEFGTNKGDEGRVRVIDAVCPSCKGIVERLALEVEGIIDPQAQAKLYRDGGFVVRDYNAPETDLKPVKGHKPGCKAS